jgi:hypothetical protein
MNAASLAAEPVARMARVIGDERVGAGVRLQLAAVRAVADELEHAFAGDSSHVPSSLVQQLAEELEHLARALRGGDHP